MDIVLLLCSFAALNLVSLIFVLVRKEPFSYINKMIFYSLSTCIIVILLNLSIYQNLYLAFSLLLFFNYVFVFCIPPLLLFIFNYLLDNKEETKVSNYILHFAIITVPVCFSTWFFLQNSEYRRHFFKQLQASHSGNPWPIILLDLILLGQMIFYITICYKKIYRLHKAGQLSEEYMWLWPFVKFLYGAVGLTLIPRVFLNAKPSFVLTVISVSIIIFYNCCLMELTKRRLVFVPLEKKQVKPAVPSTFLSEENKQKISDCLVHLINDEKLYINPNLELSDLAARCDVPKYLLTLFLNQHYGKSFPDFINYYRIEEAKRLFEDAENQRYSVEVIAQKCGFNSRSAFYSAFKKQTGITPVHFLRHYNQSEKGNQSVDPNQSSGKESSSCDNEEDPDKLVS